MTTKLECPRCSKEIKLIYGNYCLTCKHCGNVIEAPIECHPMRLEG